MAFPSATRVFGLWDQLRGSFWFLPSAMAAGAIILSFLLLRLDQWLSAEALSEFGWIYAFGPEGARAVLSAIASSMITVAGLTFSITMLTLQLASSQFGPRLLRNFMRDRGNQFVLGTFIATFTYCLMVLRTVRGTEESHFVPHIAVAFGVLLAVASLAVLIYFIHHIATAIRIETLLAELAGEASAAVDRLYPERMGDEPPSSAGAHPADLIPADFDSKALAICADRSGYVQRIDTDAIVGFAEDCDLFVRIAVRPGGFVKEGDTVLEAYPRDGISAQTAGQLHGTLFIGEERTPEQDLQFSLHRIVEIAQRALSPGTNDPATALYCLDRLGEVLAKLAKRDVPSPVRFDKRRRPRVLTEADSFDGIACPLFAAVARYGIADADVVARLLATMAMLATAAPSPGREAILKLRDDVRAEGLRRAQLGHDRDSLAD